ncbi:hypothetical protein B296_00012556 [Ensete ventricosum]|uniref:Uncharacterized protein n=1 Tax=Ensete ventricosum TaxID=4639 RepID=A0A427AZW6_ENSVE|nr:hypothetical protein B296_00012556 [Ensete ventricosum]
MSIMKNHHVGKAIRVHPPIKVFGFTLTWRPLLDSMILPPRKKASHSHPFLHVKTNAKGDDGGREGGVLVGHVNPMPLKKEGKRKEDNQHKAGEWGWMGGGLHLWGRGMGPLASLLALDLVSMLVLLRILCARASCAADAIGGFAAFCSSPDFGVHLDFRDHSVG